MVYQPVIMKQLLASNLLGRIAVPLFRPAAATEVFGRRSYHRNVNVRKENCIDPLVRTSEDEENCYIDVHLPGVNKKDVKSQLKFYGHSYLYVSGSKVQEDYERVKYSDNFDIPQFIKASDIAGEMKDGELKITLPKLKEGEEKNIEKLELQID